MPRRTISCFSSSLVTFSRYKMPPKGKKKGNKGIPAIPTEDRRVVRNREQAKKAAAKKLKISLRRLKRERKQNKTTVPSPANFDIENQESLQHETSIEDSEFEDDINLPHSSCTELCASDALGQQVTQQNDSFKESKNIYMPHSSRNEPSTSLTIGQQVNDGRKTSKKTLNDHTPRKEKSLIKPKPLVPKISTQIYENKKLSGNIVETGNDCSLKGPLNYLDDKKLHKGKQTKTQVEAENIAENETLKPTKSIDLGCNTSKNVSQNIHKKAEDFTNKENVLQQKLKAFQIDTKTLVEQKTNLTSVKAISGDIKVLPTDKSVKNSDKKDLIYSYCTADKKIYIDDESIKLSIFVNQGSQVFCNMRRRPVIDLVQNVNSCSGTLEGHATERPDEDIKTDSEKYGKTTNDTKCDSSSVSEFSSRNCRTVVDQVLDFPGTDTLIDSEQHDETATDTKFNSSSIGKFSKENDSSEITSVREKVRKLCNDFLKDFKSACETFERSWKTN